MIRVLFDSSEKTKAMLKACKSIGFEAGVSIRVDNDSVCANVEFNGFHTDFIDNFFYFCLWIPRCLYVGKRFDYDYYDPWESILFEPLGHDMSMQSQDSPGTGQRHLGNKYVVKISDFLEAAVDASENFLEFAAGVEPGIKKDQSYERLRLQILDARTWLCLRYPDSGKVYYEDPLMENISSTGDRIAYLLKQLESYDAMARCRAIGAMEKLKDAGSIGALIYMLKDDDPVVRSNAAFALGLIGDRECTRPLIEAVLDKDLLVNDRAKKALIDLGNKCSIAQVLDATFNNRDPCLYFVVETMGDASLIDTLREAMDSNDPWIRERADRLLEKYTLAGP